MKLLIVTQKVDSVDPILGFFHAWIELFARQCGSVVVIAQAVGDHRFPSNVKVVSLGKESGVSRVVQILRFWSKISSLRDAYDAVFVHMTPVWVLLGAPLWIIFRKRMYLWYEIRRGSLRLSLEMLFVRKVFAASKSGIPSDSRKIVVVGHGIDTNVFRPDSSVRDPKAVVAVGRITQVKRYDIVLSAFAKLPSDFHLKIAGGVITDRDKEEFRKIQGLISTLAINKRVIIGWVPPQEMPTLLRRTNLFLHAAEGGLDKALLEAMASGCLVVSVSASARDLLPDVCRATPETITAKVAKLLALSPDDRQSLTENLRASIERDHGLSRCIPRLVAEIQS